jgi:hypothetical protein
MTNVTYFFDPACPWTWATTKWLRQVQPVKDVQVQWRPFSLLVLNGSSVPDKYREALESSHAALRIVAKLDQSQKQDDIVRLYEHLGNQHFEDGAPMTMDLVSTSLASLGLDDLTGSLSDESLDEPVTQSTNEAIAAAGPDIGSPVITFEGFERGFHGPVVVESAMSQDVAVKIWDVVTSAVQLPEFLELKRGREF